MLFQVLPASAVTLVFNKMRPETGAYLVARSVAQNDAPFSPSPSSPDLE